MPCDACAGLARLQTISLPELLPGPHYPLLGRRRCLRCQSGSQRQRTCRVAQPGNSRGVLLLGLGKVYLAPCWAKDSKLASSCSGRGGPGHCSYCSFRDRVASCLIPWLPWALEKMWEEGAVVPCPRHGLCFPL